MKFILKLVLLSVAFCGPYYAALSMRNPVPMMLFAWVCLAASIWILFYRRKRREKRCKRQFRQRY
nr:hypothetical protein [Pedobacter panaciterrae]